MRGGLSHKEKWMKYEKEERWMGCEKEEVGGERNRRGGWSVISSNDIKIVMEHWGRSIWGL